MLLHNRYQIIQTLGSGGFGETFLAEDTQMPSRRRCVIKQLKPIANNPEIYQLVQQRFQREAAILEELGGSYDGIPSLYAYFQLDDLFYLVQEWVEGDTLTTRLKQQGLFSENAVKKILTSILPILEYVHSKRIIHRDIKPDNIILRDRDGEPVLIDFGAVRECMGTIINSQGSPTSSIVIGTPGYMPSEQAAGRPIYSSDLYSLGITAIYLLTGKQPPTIETDSRTGDILWQIHAPHISSELQGVIDRSIQYHPRDRFATAREMLDALQGVVSEGESLSTREQGEIKTLPPTEVPVTQPINISPSSPGNENFNPQNPPPTIQTSNKNVVILGGTIGGGLIAAAIAGVILTRPAKNDTEQRVTQPITPSVSTGSIPTANSNSFSPAGNKYAWLSQKRVTDADLQDKSGFELDIMRNSIYAHHGRRFQTPGLQEYFDNQSWYRPQYSASDFPDNLLSEIEKMNVDYINRYQDINNRRHFRK